MTNTDNHKTLHALAIALAPVLRDKFDFSSDEDFKKWADLSFKAGQAFLDKTNPLFDEAIKKDAAINQAIIDAKKAAAEPMTEIKP